MCFQFLFKDIHRWGFPDFQWSMSVGAAQANARSPSVMFVLIDGISGTAQVAIVLIKFEI